MTDYEVIDQTKKRVTVLERKERELESKLEEVRKELDLAKKMLEAAGAKPRKKWTPAPQEEVRDAVRRLGNFTVKQLAEACGISTGAATYKLKPYLNTGAVTRVRHGHYVYHKPTEAGPGNPSAAGTHDATGAVPVAGTGGSSLVNRIQDKDVRGLVKKALASDPTLMLVGKGGHLKLSRGGRSIATVPTTPSDHRTKANLRSDIKRNAGVEI